MYLELFVHPLSVSFSGLKFEEIPCFRGSHGGYFNNLVFTNIWCHSEENGAGEWHDIDVVGNRVGGEDVVDTVSLPDELPRVTATGEFTSDISCRWSTGFIEWEIPCGWNIASGNSSPYREFAAETRHRLELDSEGTVVLRKLGNEVSRAIDGKIFLNGIRVDVQ